MHPGPIIFDCDDALVDNKPGATAVWVEVTAE
jgi:hypothetical protein